MNVEANRLRTFADWPQHAVVHPARIAKAGFFYTKHAITVECFACHVRIEQWSYDDQVMARHQQLSPECPFVKDPAASGNVPHVVANGAHLDVEMDPTDERLRTEEFRLRTFDRWPVSDIVTPASLARAGFYSVQHHDLTKCAYCGGVVGSWEVGDDPDREHARHFPNCMFVVGVINRRTAEVDATARNRVAEEDATVRDLANRRNLPNINLVRDGNLAALGVNTHKGPKKPKYGTLEARMATFADWPEDLVQTPDALAASGFYYEGSGDQVRCFHCDGGLKHWDPHDEPWTEHARWFPHCGFVALLKGQEFISACAPELDPTSIKELQSAQRKTAQHRKEITERELQAHMLAPATRAALDVGLQVERVRQAIREKLERTGVGFYTGDALIEATLNLQRDADDEHNDGEDSQIARSVTSMLNEVISSLHEPETARARVSSTTTTVATEVRVAVGVAGDDAPTTSALAPKLSLEEENRLLKEARLCKICMDSEVGIVFLPCGHLATCINCAPNLQDCPVCRCAIKATVRTFLS